jgi:glycerophosphoryl diester phosphodiesterase
MPASKIVVIAHRGFSGKFPENTLRAFKEALSLKAAAIELDVHLSKDKELVVTHDFAFGRCVKATGLLSDYTAAELLKFDAGSHKGAEFKTERISKLSDILELINHQCLLNIEIKQETLVDPTAYDQMIDKLLILVKNYGMKDVLFSSFDHHALKVLRDKSADARIAVLDDRADQGPQIALAKSLRAECYNVNLKRVTAEQVNDLHKAGLKVFAYTAKNSDDLTLVSSLKLDGVFADNLDEAQAFFSK